MKHLLYFTSILLFVFLASCNQKKSENEKSVEKKDDSPKFEIEAKGINVKNVFFALNDKNTKMKTHFAPFGDRILVYLDSLEGFTEVDGKCMIGFNYTITEGNKTVVKLDDFFAKNYSEGIEKEKLNTLYAFADLFHPFEPDKTYSWNLHIWDKNSDKELFVKCKFEMTGKVVGDFVVENNSIYYTAITLKNHDEIMSDNVFHPGDLAKVTILGVEGFKKSENGYVLEASYYVTDKDNNILAEEKTQEIVMDEIYQVFGTLPIQKVNEPTLIYWHISYKDKNSDAQIKVRTSLRLEL